MIQEEKICIHKLGLKYERLVFFLKCILFTIIFLFSQLSAILSLCSNHFNCGIGHVRLISKVTSEKSVLLLISEFSKVIPVIDDNDFLQ